MNCAVDDCAVPKLGNEASVKVVEGNVDASKFNVEGWTEVSRRYLRARIGDYFRAELHAS